MTSEEAYLWRLYAAKNGLDPVIPRNEVALANIAHLICVAANIKSAETNLPYTADHFRPWSIKEEPISLENAMKSWK